jgi:hypothetical protein
MAARSTGMYPREDYNIDEAMQVPASAGGSVALLGDLSKAKTIRVIVVGATIIDDAEIQISFDTGDTVFVTSMPTVASSLSWSTALPANRYSSL